MIIHLPPQYNKEMEEKLQDSLLKGLVSMQWLFAFITADQISVIVSIMTATFSVIKFLPDFLKFVRKAILQIWFLGYFFRHRKKRQEILKTWLADFEKEKIENNEE